MGSTTRISFIFWDEWLRHTSNLQLSGLQQNLKAPSILHFVVRQLRFGWHVEDPADQPLHLRGNGSTRWRPQRRDTAIHAPFPCRLYGAFQRYNPHSNLHYAYPDILAGGLPVTSVCIKLTFFKCFVVRALPLLDSKRVRHCRSSLHSFLTLLTRLFLRCLGPGVMRFLVALSTIFLVFYMPFDATLYFESIWIITSLTNLMIIVKLTDYANIEVGDLLKPSIIN